MGDPSSKSSTHTPNTFTADTDRSELPNLKLRVVA